MGKDITNITILTGSTASGKTARAIDIANEKNGVIINADAMQMYDALPILSAQPDAQELAAAPHRLYGSQHPNTNVNAANWRELAIEEISRCEARGTHPIFVGGTGFYIKALINGLSPIPDVDMSIRRDLNEYAKTRAVEEYYAEFASLDPEMAKKLKPTDTQRITRAWEVLKGTGKSLSYWQELPLIAPPEHYRFELIVLQPDKELLNKRIRMRIEKMLNAGALDEVRDLSDKIDAGEVRTDAFIVKAHGFRPFREYLKGQWSLDEAIECTDAETRQYAKRQRTWARTQYGGDNRPQNTNIQYLDV